VGSDPELIRRGRREIDEFAANIGRDPHSIAISTSVGLGRSAAESVDRLSALHALGVEMVVINVGGRDQNAPAICAGIESFATEVRPQLPGFDFI
jgi:alkanesulfonate monooxygenase SsuD/methylene tetrahydromethanopterin reductase-like flavin-dependent oxidoreductase (luciferase family)